MMTDNSQETDEGLVRGIGTWALGTNIVNMVVGAGIFTLPGIVAAQLGPAALVAYLACAVIVGMIFLCYAEIGSRVSRSGGSYAYIEEAFGPFAGFVASTMLWLGWSVVGDAALAVAMTDALSLKIPMLADGATRNGFLVALFAFLAVINIVGLKSGMRTVIVNTIAKMVPLVLLAVVGLFYIEFDKLVIVEWPSLHNFGAAALILFLHLPGQKPPSTPVVKYETRRPPFPGACYWELVAYSHSMLPCRWFPRAHSGRNWPTIPMPR
jgi:amino acid transporter